MTPTFDEHLERWYSSVKEWTSFRWHLNTIIQDADRMLESCCLASLNLPHSVVR
jgi:hypothetical protein